ncbi:MAG: hypothetical protein RR799_09600 [Lachnospiraceae bacterium]
MISQIVSFLLPHIIILGYYKEYHILIKDGQYSTEVLPYGYEKYEQKTRWI